MWDLIVSVHDHCLSFYLILHLSLMLSNSILFVDEILLFSINQS